MKENNYTYLIKGFKTNDFGIEDNEKCIECNGKRIIINKENCLVCMDCGLEYELNYQSNEITGESRAFADKTCIKINEVNLGFGARTTIGNYCDYKKSSLTPKMREDIARMNKLQNQHIDYQDAKDRMALSMLKRLSYNLELTDCVEKTAWKIYESACKKEFFKRKSIDNFINAALYTAIRVHKVSIFFEDVTKNLDIDKKKIEHLVQLIVINVLPELNLKYKPVSAISIIHKFSPEFKLNNEEYNEACEIYKSAEKNGLNFSGKDPKGLAAASIYIEALKAGKKITQKIVYKTIKINKTTLQKGIKEIRNYINRG